MSKQTITEIGEELNNLVKDFLKSKEIETNVVSILIHGVDISMM